jgi:hypothetical protein
VDGAKVDDAKVDDAKPDAQTLDLDAFRRHRQKLGGEVE